MSSRAPHEVFEACLPEIQRIASRCGIRNVRMFGSVARGESGSASDIDFLVDLDPGRDLLDLIAAKQDLEDLLGRKVDIVTERSLSPYIREVVMKDLVYL